MLPRSLIRRAAMWWAVAAMCAACGSRPAPTSQHAHPRGAIALTLNALDGGEVHTAEYRGRVVILHVFTTWSLAAQRDLPQLIDAHQRYGERLAIIGVAIEPDGYRMVAPWREVTKVPYLITLGSDTIVSGTSALGPVTQVPTTIILKPDGRIAHWIERPLLAGELNRHVSALVPKQKTAR